MLTLNSPQVVQETALRWKRDCKVAIVPTMGCLHEGHLALVDRARLYAEKVIVSLFVNPLQFGPTEDFEKYPRAFADDEAKCEAAGVDMLFNPSVDDLYGDGFATKVRVAGVAEPLEGHARPGHFEGVATVCLKLFQITQADFAVFGEKDYQQLRVIQTMAHDLNLPLTIIPQPIVREPDGLALSSRNRYLSPEERKTAAIIPTALREARASLARDGAATVGKIVDKVKEAVTAKGLVVDYVAIASARDLVPAEAARKVLELSSPRIFFAARLGTTRLIDNVALDGENV